MFGTCAECASGDVVAGGCGGVRDNEQVTDAKPDPQPTAEPSRRGERRRHRRPGGGPLRVVQRRAAHARRGRRVRGPLPPWRDPRQRTRPAAVVALADDPAPRGPAARRPDRRAGAVAQRARRARDVRRRRRRGLHRPRRAGRGSSAGRLAGPDALHDAGRGRGPHRGRSRSRGAQWPQAPRTRPRCWPASTTCSRAPSWRSTPRPPGRLAGCGPSRRSGSLAASRGSARTPTTAPSPTRSAGSRRPCTSTRAATADRRPSLGCTPWVGHRAGSRCCTSTAPTTDCRPAALPCSTGRSEVGFVGSSARHHEYGPIALALFKRNVPIDAQLDADGLPAMQEIVVDPEVGLHVRPLR